MIRPKYKVVGSERQGYTLYKREDKKLKRLFRKWKNVDTFIRYSSVENYIKDDVVVNYYDYAGRHIGG